MNVKQLLEYLIDEKDRKYRKGIYGYTQRALAYKRNLTPLKQFLTI